MFKTGFSIKYKAPNTHLKITLLLALLCLKLISQPPELKLQFKLYDYIEQYSEEAINQMIQFKIPASVVLAQAIFESGSGTSKLAKKSNNHFGIKCHDGWVGDTIVKDDDTLNECFRKYETVAESYRDHSLFLVTRERYAHLFQLSSNDYVGWCNGLKNAGYATYPSYAEELIRLIEEEKLYELDQYIPLEQKTFSLARSNKAEPEIKSSKLKSNSFSILDFSKNGFLWLEAKDVLIQSLDMIIETGGEEGEGFADINSLPR